MQKHNDLSFLKIFTSSKTSGWMSMSFLFPSTFWPNKVSGDFRIIVSVYFLTIVLLDSTLVRVIPDNTYKPQFTRQQFEQKCVEDRTNWGPHKGAVKFQEQAGFILVYLACSCHSNQKDLELLLKLTSSAFFGLFLIISLATHFGIPSAGSGPWNGWAPMSLSHSIHLKVTLLLSGRINLDLFYDSLRYSYRFETRQQYTAVVQS